MSIYLDKTLGKWRATYNYCGVKYRIPGLYMSRKEAVKKWNELDKYIQGGCCVEECVYRFFITVNRKKLEKLGGEESSGDDSGLMLDDDKLRGLQLRDSYMYDDERQPGIMYETYLYDVLCEIFLEE